MACACPMLLCSDIENIYHILNYVGVNLRVTFEGVVVSFPSGYGITGTAEQKTEDDSDRLVFNSWNSVIGQFDRKKKILRIVKTPIPFLELRDELKQAIKKSVQAVQSSAVPLTREMIESSTFPNDKFNGVFTFTK
jgi:hypothetical protein